MIFAAKFSAGLIASTTRFFDEVIRHSEDSNVDSYNCVENQ